MLCIVLDCEPKIIKSSQLKNYDPERFIKELQTVDWESILQTNDVNIMSLQWESFKVLGNHAPIRQHQVRNSFAAYIDMGLKHKISLRDFYKKHFSKAIHPEDWKLFQNFRNITNVEKRKKKKIFYSFTSFTIDRKEIN